jgi:hypothetical protein
VAEAGDLHFGTEPFGGECRPAPEEEIIFADFGIAENFDGACQSCLSGSNSLSDMTNFSRGFFEASGEEGFRDGAETEASLVELLGESDRE